MPSLGAGEKVKLIKCLPHKHEDMGSNPRHPWKKLSVVCTLILPPVRKQSMALRGNWAAREAELLSSGSDERPCLKTYSGGVWIKKASNIVPWFYTHTHDALVIHTHGGISTHKYMPQTYIGHTYILYNTHLSPHLLELWMSPKMWSG